MGLLNRKDSGHSLIVLTNILGRDFPLQDIEKEVKALIDDELIVLGKNKRYQTVEYLARKKLEEEANET